jgi:hypothetical protein
MQSVAAQTPSGFVVKTQVGNDVVSVACRKWRYASKLRLGPGGGPGTQRRTSLGRLHAKTLYPEQYGKYCGTHYFVLVKNDE